jgi:hypothetical protein
VGSTFFFLVGGFFCFGGCIALEDCALVVFSVVLWCVGGFFSALVTLSAFDGAFFSATSFFCFFEVIREECCYCGWSSHLPN